MVRLLVVLCTLHTHVCQRVDPMYAAMPVLVCNMRQMQLAEAWAVQNPEIVAGRRIARTMCVAPEKIGGSA